MSARESEWETRGDGWSGRVARFSAGLRSRDYYSVLRRLQTTLQPRTYLEIGIRKGDSLALARHAEVALGIDPAPMLKRPPAPSARIFNLTSDEFFATHNVRQELGGRDLDLAFIDGMHLFEYVVRDFANVEAHSTPDTVIVLHDCLPVDARSAARERTTPLWTGDVWKAALVLLRYRPDLRMTVIGAPPSGLILIEDVDPASRVLQHNAERIVEEFAGLGFDHWEEHRDEVHALVVDADVAMARLAARKAATGAQ